MSKEKQKAVKVKLDKPNFLPDMKTLVFLEFNDPTISLSAFDNEKQYFKFLDKLIHNFERLHMQKSTHMAKMDNAIKQMLIFLDKYPELFGENYEEVSRDMFKVFLGDHIIKCEKLLAKVEKIEISQQDLVEQIEEIGRAYGARGTEILEQLRSNPQSFTLITQQVATKKVRQLIVENAKFSAK